MDYEKIIKLCFKEVRETLHFLNNDDKSEKVGIGKSGDQTYKIDKLSENAIIDVIRDNIPDCYIISEEAGNLGKESSDITVLIDPIDGSTNAIHNIPIFSSTILIAKGRRFKEIISTGVYDLNTDEIFLSSENKIPTLNGKQISVSSTEKLDSAIIAINPRTLNNIKNNTNISDLLDEIRYPRCFGSAALEIAYVANGRLDGFIDYTNTLRLFDCLPSIYSVIRSGGFIHLFNSDIKDIDIRLGSRLGIIATCNDSLGKQILSFLS